MNCDPCRHPSSTSRWAGEGRGWRTMAEQSRFTGRDEGMFEGMGGGRRPRQEAGAEGP